MSEHMRFLPQAQVLSLEELDQIASAFVEMGVAFRLTGLPLVSSDIATRKSPGQSE
jgi:cyclic pyranopterin phosphate synthase